MGKKSKKWTELSHEGRYIRRAFNLAGKILKDIENKVKEDPTHVPDLERLEQIVSVMTKCAKMNTDIIKATDHDERLKNIELIIENIPPEIITQVRKNLKI